MEFKKNEIVVAVKKNSDVFNFLIMLHNSFISSALTLASQAENCLDKFHKYSMKLANASLSFFQYNTISRPEIAKKVLKKSKIFLYSIKNHNAKESSKFFNDLKNVMENLIPNFCHYSFSSYFLFKLEQIKNFDQLSGQDLYNTFDKISNLFLLTSDFSFTVKKNFESILEFFFASPCNNVNAIEEFTKNYTISDKCDKFSLFLLISIIFNHGIRYWYKLFENNWNNIVSAEKLKVLLSEMLELIKQYHR